MSGFIPCVYVSGDNSEYHGHQAEAFSISLLSLSNSRLNLIDN